MIIVSQDKRETINFNRVKNIKLDPVMNYKHIIANVGDDYYETIGEYETEERAKEVLEEIAERYSNWENFLAGQPQGICSPKYEMPLE